MITDPQKIRRGDPGRPEICNVFSYEKLFGTPAERVAEIDRTCRTGELGCREHKDEIARADRRVPAARSASGATQALADRGELERLLDAGRRARPRDRRAEHGAREGGDGPVNAAVASQPAWTLRPRRLRGAVRPARHADPQRGRRPARGPPRRDRARLHRAARGARRARPRGRDRVPDPDRRAAGAEVAADAARARRRRASTSSRRRRSRSCSRGCSSTAGSAPRRSGCTSASPPSGPTATARRRCRPSCAGSRSRRRGKAYEPERAGRRDARRCCARRRPVDTEPHDADHGVARAPPRAPARAARHARRASRSTTRSADADRMTQAVTLFALLELYKSGELVWRQRENFGEIEIMAPSDESMNPIARQRDRAAVLLARAGQPRRPGEALGCAEARPRRRASRSCASAFAPQGGRASCCARSRAG